VRGRRRHGGDRQTGRDAGARTSRGGRALTAWARTGAAARLIDADFDHGALLLEQIRPGTHLIWEAVVFRPAVPGVPRGGEIGSFSPLKPGRARGLGVSVRA